ncbi:hypothetical protein [Pseudomonas sp.]|uniref:hypothetical protein n=1 Tax=Pseudomonas sp. TaxID=306 RepID=UPI003C71CD30
MTKKSYIYGGVLLLAYSGALCAEDVPLIEALPESYIYMYTSKQNVDDLTAAQRQLYDEQRMWEPGRKLRVCTFGGNKTVARLIRDVAGEWSNYSSVKLDFGPDSGGYNCLDHQRGYYQIRVGFGSSGYWSLIGRDSESMIDPLSPSMNIARFNRIYSEGKFSPSVVTEKADAYHKAVIRHEFGHALGLLHEHQNPNTNCQAEIKWSGPGNVYEYFARAPHEWDRDQVDRNLGFIGQVNPSYVARKGDFDSIMIYNLPSEIYNDRNSRCANIVNYNISDLDKKIIAQIYPPASFVSASVDVPLSGAAIRPLPAIVSAYNKDGLLQRALVDLESNDKYTRRDARVRLADMIKSDLPKETVSDLIRDLDGGSYRYQLGVSTALSQSEGKVELNTTDKKVLEDLTSTIEDGTLKSVIKNIH